MNINETMLVPIIGIIGVLIGSLLTASGYLYKNRIDKIRIINQNIFYLLKLFHLVCAFRNIDKLSSLYWEKIDLYFSNKEKKEFSKEDSNKFFTNLLITWMQPVLYQLDDDFNTCSRKALIELSSLNPVVSYEISKNFYFELLMKQINDKLISVQNAENTINGFEIGLKVSQKKITTKFSLILKKGIRRISWNANFMTFITCRYEIKKIQNKYREQDIKNFLSEYVETVLSDFKGLNNT